MTRIETLRKGNWVTVNFEHGPPMNAVFLGYSNGRVELLEYCPHPVWESFCMPAEYSFPEEMVCLERLEKYAEV